MPNSGQKIRAGLQCGLLLLILPIAESAWIDRETAAQALDSLSDLVGSWQGTGQPRRGVAPGAWRESIDWAWDHTPEVSALMAKIETGKYVRTIRIEPDPSNSTQLRMKATLADGSSRTFLGRKDKQDRFVFEARTLHASGPTRITLSPLHETRFLMLLETREGEQPRWNRLGEIGYTRQGVRFAAGSGEPECLVTGGKGTIPVTHQGKTYYVCCSGCRDLFESDPESILEDARAEGRIPPGAPTRTP